MAPTPRRQAWLIARGLLRAAVSCAALLVLFYKLPLTRWSNGSTGFEMAVALCALTGTAAWQLRAVVRSPYPAIRATQSLAVTVPLFLILFAATYYTTDANHPSSFSQGLTRSDALYFTVTVFSTVGFGDITPTAETARIVVTVQMLLDLVVLGLGIQVVLGAVRRGRGETVVKS